jgi:hypothetical protein
VRAARAWRRGLGPLQDETPTLLELAEVFLGDHPGLVEDIQDAISDSGEILGSASPPWAHEIIRDLDAALTNQTLAVMDGQGHNAMDEAPELLVTQLVSFFS